MIGDIRKMSLSYAKCPSGDLHTGQILSLVCVDAKCQKRGLICPICRMMNHQGHEVLPLKIFIEQVKKSFLQSQDAQSLNNLSDYLRRIDETKKQLLTILRETAQTFAKQLKKLEQKIQQNYISIRKNILAQSTMSTKLPIFIESLIKKQDNDPHKLQQEFQKYSELIKFDKSTIQISDKAKKIVQDYSSLPSEVQSVLKDQVEKMKTGFKDILSQKSIKNPNKKNEGYTFSTQNKHKQMKLNDDKKQIFGSQVIEEYGIAYVQGECTPNRKITFKIQAASSSNIVLGMGLPKKDKDIGFIFSSAIQNQHFIINSDGYCQNYQQNYDESSDPATSFNYHQSGTTVTVHLEQQKNQITFTKVETGQTKVLSISKLSEEDKKDLQFLVSLGENDRVKILDQ